MKIDVPRALVEGVLLQLASTRDVQREKHKNTVEWDRSPLGQLYSMFSIELGRNSRASMAGASAAANRRKVRARFTK